MPNFTDIANTNSQDLLDILASAKQIKHRLKSGETYRPLIGKQLAMIFEKPSTRTRASFEVGINQLGGQAIVLNSEQSQLGRGEPISDTAQVLSRYVDIMMIRCYKHESLMELAKLSSVPVINGLTDYSHPCQIMADVMTFEEHRGDISGKKIAWVGDGNNMVTSWVQAAVKLNFSLSVATPKELSPNNDLLEWAKSENADVTFTNCPEEAAEKADLVTTDTWVSMGDSNAEERHKLLLPYQVNKSLMEKAKENALFMHCLPAHREEEVTSEIIDGPQSVIFDEAENRLHIQKAIMIWCLKNHLNIV